MMLVKHCLKCLVFFPSKQDAERQHREVVSIYRTHLLSAAQVIVYKCVLNVKVSFSFAVAFPFILLL